MYIILLGVLLSSVASFGSQSFFCENGYLTYFINNRTHKHIDSWFSNPLVTALEKCWRLSCSTENGCAPCFALHSFSVPPTFLSDDINIVYSLTHNSIKAYLKSDQCCKNLLHAMFNDENYIKIHYQAGGTLRDISLFMNNYQQLISCCSGEKRFNTMPLMNIFVIDNNVSEEKLNWSIQDNKHIPCIVVKSNINQSEKKTLKNMFKTSIN